MATAVLPLCVEYYQTMKTTEEARLCVARSEHKTRFFAEAVLYFPFFAMTRTTSKLISLLEKFEAQPSSLLLEEECEKMPQDLQDLFKKMCNVIQQTERVGLSDGLLLKNSVVKLGELSQEIKGFADRFADAQSKLRTRVPAELVPEYKESFTAYAGCGLTAEPFLEDDKKSHLLRF